MTKVHLTGLLISCLALCCCASASKHITTIEICLANQPDREVFLESMRESAQLQNMKFIDNSKTTQEDINLSSKANLISKDIALINIGIEGPDGVGVTAGNLGLSHKVALGFSYGYNDVLGKKLLHQVVSILKKHWTVKSVISDRGVVPSVSCG